MTDYTYSDTTFFIENAIYRDPSLSVFSKLLYAALASYCDEDGVAQVTRAELASAMSTSVRTVHRAVTEGIAHGFLTTTRTHQGPLRYQLHDFQTGYNRRKAKAAERAALLPPPPPPGPFPVSNPDKLGRYLTVGARDGWTCRYCEVPLANCVTRENWLWDGSYWRPENGYATPELDHVVPRSRGGENRVPNLALACIDCNAAKRGHALDELPDGWWRRPAHQPPAQRKAS